MADTTKKCSKCGEVKLLGEFYLDKRVKSGIKAACKSCTYAVTKNWSNNNKEKRKSICEKYRSNHRIELREKQKQYDKTHAEQKRRRNQAWQINNPDRSRFLKKMWCRNNKESGLTWVANNRDKVDNAYIRRIFSNGIGISKHDVPQSIVDLKREQLKLTRLIKEKQK